MSNPVDKPVRPPASAEPEPPTLPPDVAPSDPLATRGALPPSDAPIIGARDEPTVPGFEIQRELGRGGMGVVYKARQVKFNRIVALKMILAGSHASKADLARIVAEAEAVAQLQHPNVVQLFDADQHAGLPYLTLEFISGGSLSERLRGTPMTPGQAAALIEQLARGVQASHERGIIHRDLKPGNVLLTADGTPKLTDFGLARRLAGGNGLTATGAIMGTPSYMAPEQAEGKGKAVGPLADVYALGAILYECLTGRPPFQGPTPLDTLVQVVGDDPVPPRRLQPKVPRDLETICLKCLHKEPAKRYASALELAADLQRFQSGETIRARPVGQGEKLLRWCRRNPAVAVSIGTITVLLTATAVGGLLAAGRFSQIATEVQEQRDEARRQRDDAHLNLYVSHMNLAQREWEQGRVPRMLDLLEEHAASEDSGKQPLFEWNYLWHLAHSAQLALEGERCVAYSPNGRFLATVRRGSGVVLFEARTGKEVQSLGGQRADKRCGIQSRQRPHRIRR